MFKKALSVSPRLTRTTWALTLLCLLALGASACQINLPDYSLTPTPTSTPPTVLGFIPQAEATSTLEGLPGATATATSDGDDSPDPSDLDLSVDGCALVSQSEAEAVLGMPVDSPTPGSEPDDVSGGTLYFCTYMGTGLALVASYVELESPEAAKSAMDQQLGRMMADEPATITSSVAGLGERAVWATSEHAGSITVATGNFVFSLAVGGNVGDPAAYKTALKDLAASVSGRL